MHQWYWSYQYPDFLNSNDEFVEFDSYIVPESDLDDENILLSSLDPFMGYPHPGTPNSSSSSLARDLLTTRCLNQKGMYSVYPYASPMFSADAVLDTPELRQEVVTRFRASNAYLEQDSRWSIHTLRKGIFKGEERVYLYNTQARMTLEFFDLIKR